MKKIIIVSVFSALAAGVSGCAQQEEVVLQPIVAEPTFSKFGGEGEGGCVGQAGTADCLPPPDRTGQGDGATGVRGQTG